MPMRRQKSAKGGFRRQKPDGRQASPRPYCVHAERGGKYSTRLVDYEYVG